MWMRNCPVQRVWPVIAAHPPPRRHLHVLDRNVLHRLLLLLLLQLELLRLLMRLLLLLLMRLLLLVVHDRQAVGPSACGRQGVNPPVPCHGLLLLLLLVLLRVVHLLRELMLGMLGLFPIPGSISAAPGGGIGPCPCSGDARRNDLLLHLSFHNLLNDSAPSLLLLPKLGSNLLYGRRLELAHEEGTAHGSTWVLRGYGLVCKSRADQRGQGEHTPHGAQLKARVFPAADKVFNQIYARRRVQYNSTRRKNSTTVCT